jgi:predicted TIM-barrel fold metal-dependent hydrolase
MLFARHPRASIIWAHTGLGRIIQPVENHVGMLESILSDPAYRHVNFDISWDEVAKYAVATPDAIKRTAALFNKFPDRFLFGTDTVAPAEPKPYYAVYDTWKPVFALLKKETKDKILKGNYERIFDQGRKNVRAWEQAHAANRN